VSQRPGELDDVEERVERVGDLDLHAGVYVCVAPVDVDAVGMGIKALDWPALALLGELGLAGQVPSDRAFEGASRKLRGRSFARSSTVGALARAPATNIAKASVTRPSGVAAARVDAVQAPLA
jgi:hypothetical protein